MVLLGGLRLLFIPKTESGILEVITGIPDREVSADILVLPLGGCGDGLNTSGDSQGFTARRDLVRWCLEQERESQCRIEGSASARGN